jgi:hypothetical protein
MKFTRSVGLCILVAALAAGCSSHRAYLVPAPTANLTNGGHAATATVMGVTMTVTPNDWDGKPGDLSAKVTPLKVRIENHSNDPIRLAYEDFHLETPEGERLPALPPSEITGVAYIGQNQAAGAHLVEAAWQRRGGGPGRGRIPGSRPVRIVVRPAFGFRYFYYAPYWNYAYPGLTPWPYAWAPNIGYYSTYYPYMRAVHLPTQSMLQKGLPEGVIGAGGYVEGFLYFRRVSPDLHNVDFVGDLQNANTGNRIATIQIPFRVESKPGD